MRLLLAEDRAVLSDALLSQLGRARPGRAGPVLWRNTPPGAQRPGICRCAWISTARCWTCLPMVDGLTVPKRVRAAKPALPA